MVFAVSAVVAGALLGIPALIAPKRYSLIKMEPFECGKDPVALPEGRFAIKFSTIAIFFIIFHRMAPVLKRVYDQMCEPKWVVAFGVCTCTGGFYDNYATVQGIDTIIPVDVYIPGCPPRPESVIDGLMKLQDKIAAGAQRY